MNPYTSVIVLLLVALLGCSPKSPMSDQDRELMEKRLTDKRMAAPTNTPTVLEDFEKSKDKPETWASVMQIWRCEDGLFEVRTAYTSEGKFFTEEQARAAKTNWAIRMASAHKQGLMKFELPTLPDCGKRIE